MIPIIIPIPTGGGKDPVCPRCGRPEDKKTTCGNCGYKYPEGGGGCLLVVVVPAFIGLFCWFILTAFQWLTPWEGNPSLEEVLRNQWEWVQSKAFTENQKKARVFSEWARIQYARARLLPQYEPPEPYGVYSGVVTNAGSGVVLRSHPFLFPENDEEGY